MPFQELSFIFFRYIQIMNIWLSSLTVCYTVTCCTLEAICYTAQPVCSTLSCLALSRHAPCRVSSQWLNCLKISLKINPSPYVTYNKSSMILNLHLPYVSFSFILFDTIVTSLYQSYLLIGSILSDSQIHINIFYKFNLPTSLLIDTFVL